MCLEKFQTVVLTIGILFFFFFFFFLFFLFSLFPLSFSLRAWKEIPAGSVSPDVWGGMNEVLLSKEKLMRAFQFAKTCFSFIRYNLPTLLVHKGRHIAWGHDRETANQPQ